MNEFMSRLENNIQRPARVTAHPSTSQPVLLSFTREQLEQALQESEMEEILNNARMDYSSSKLARNLSKAIIDRLFMWQAVNRSIQS